MTQTWLEPAKQLVFILGLFALVYVAIASTTPELLLAVNDNYSGLAKGPAKVKALAMDSAPELVR